MGAGELEGPSQLGGRLPGLVRVLVRVLLLDLRLAAGRRRAGGLAT